MKTKLSVFVAIAMALAAVALNGKEEESKFSTELAVNALQRYYDDNAIPTSNAAVVQTDLVISHENGVYVEAWRSIGARSRSVSGDYADESRYFLGWSGEVFGKLSLDAGIGYYDVYGSTGDLKNYYVEVSRSFETAYGTWTPSVLRETYFTKDSAGYDGGSRTFLALSHEIEVRRATIEQRLSAMYESAFGYAKAWTYEYSATVSWKVNEHVSIILPSVRYLKPTAYVDGQERRLILGIGAKVSF